MKSVSLTPRDWCLLRELYDLTVMSFQQVWTRHFARAAKPTVINRLTKLEKAGLIRRLRVPQFLVTSTENQISVVYQITRVGISSLQKRTFDEVLREEPIRLHPQGVDHDVLLNDVVHALKLKFMDSKIIHGKLFENNSEPSDPKPDAVMVFKNGTNHVAVELELTLKSFERYRDLVLKYRLSKTFNHVIYVTSNPAIEAKLIQAITNQPLGKNQILFEKGEKPMTGKFYFVEASELLKSLGQAKITNGETVFEKGGEHI